MTFYFEVSGTVEADSEQEADEKIHAGVGLLILDVNALEEKIEDPSEDEDETTA